jgi:hypothetical protein
MLQPNLIDDILDECESVETPREWIYWSLVCAIAAAAGSNYHLKAFGGKVTYRPNIYVILMGESGLGKAFPISLSKNLIEKSDVTRVIYGRSSIQAIIKDISQTYTREGKEMILDSRCFIVNGELSTAIIGDPDSLTILTDIYDPHTIWVNNLKGDGKEKLKDTATTALFGSSPAHFYDKIPQENIEGGYIRRNLIIKAEKRYKDLDMFSSDDIDDIDFPFSKYIPHIISIAEGSGRMVPSGNAKEMLNTFRRQWRLNQPEDTTGFANSVPDQIVKVAMCLCLADYGSFKSCIINHNHMEEAIEKVVPLAHTSRTVSGGTGLDPLAKQTKMVLDYLTTAPDNQMTRRDLLTKGYGNYDCETIDKILSNLEEIHWIIKIRIPAGRNSDIMIRLHGKPLEDYKAFMENAKKKKEKVK